MVGKTKRFTFDRLCAIVDYFISLEVNGCSESQKVSHTVEFYACINMLVKEELLKKVIMRIAVVGLTESEDLLRVGYKCNFDKGFVERVAESIKFHLSEYLFETEVDNAI
jgi:hypothetical protein